MGKFGGDIADATAHANVNDAKGLHAKPTKFVNKIHGKWEFFNLLLDFTVILMPWEKFLVTNLLHD